MRQTTPEERIRREEKLLKEGRKKYIGELRKQLAQLSELSVTQEADMNLDIALKLYRLVHTLKGSAPMFGFIRIGAIAEQLVLRWEWAQDFELTVIQEHLIRNEFQTSLVGSAALMQQLSMELDIYEQELDLDEHQEQMSKRMPLMALGSRLLVIDDDDVLRSYLVRRFKLEGYAVDEARDVAEAQKLLREFNYDLILLDLMMHPQSGYELFEFVKEDPTLKWISLVVLSGRNHLHDKVRCFYLGADDFITKPFQYEELSARVYSLLKRTKDFEQMAFRDPLTGVYNRRYFDHQVKVELQRIERYPSPMSLVFIDIDRFKSINDTYGHHIGDLVLQGLAHLLQNHLRTTDVLARFGGEEFVIIFPGMSGPQTLKVVESILEHARSGPVAQNEGQAIHITFSAGICEWSSRMTVEEWIKKSDDAMYTAKQNGRNGALLYSEGMSAAEIAGTVTVQERKKTVLIADDDRILRSILVSKLKHLPVTFVEAVDGEEAYTILKSQQIDLCILDGLMPRLDGFEMLERMKEESSKPEEVRILMLSGRSREEDLTRGLELGVDTYMHKPFSMVELEVKVKQLLELG
ncbi:diguanylate cyclase [Paenibacillus periandrae]|uniref:diguanylate cyclase n=1 Tax=Paenibacillus periandrae TaxID=1761741 RepID=UPI001F09BB1F|nr:diguanylate cyclase [Paenibacillus periandrae]